MRWDEVGGRELDQLAGDVYNVRRKAGESDVEFRHRLTYGTAIVIPASTMPLPGVVRDKLLLMQTVLTRAWEAGYFDSRMDTTLSRPANLERIAEAGREFLRGSGVELRVVTRTVGVALELWPKWEEWEVTLRGDAAYADAGAGAGTAPGDAEVVQPQPDGVPDVVRQ